MRLRVFDFKLQTLLNEKKETSTIYYVKNIEVKDMQELNEKFNKVLWKREMPEDNVIGIL